MIHTQPRPVWERGAVDHGRVARAGDGARAGAGGVGSVRGGAAHNLCVRCLLERCGLGLRWLLFLLM